MGSIDERRDSERVPAAKDLECFIAGQSTDAKLRNLSAGGAMIEVQGLHARRGDQVLLRIVGLTSLVGKVSWTDGGMIGFEFKVPLHPSVVEYLGFEEHGLDVPMNDRRKSA